MGNAPPLLYGSIYINAYIKQLLKPALGFGRDRMRRLGSDVFMQVFIESVGIFVFFFASLELLKLDGVDLSCSLLPHSHRGPDCLILFLSLSDIFAATKIIGNCFALRTDDRSLHKVHRDLRRRILTSVPRSVAKSSFGSTTRS